MNDVRGTLLNITRNVTKSSGDLIKSTKLTVSLANEEELLKGLYLDIGKKVHEIYQYGGSLGKFFDEKYLEIEACERNINELREKIAVIKGVRECPKCRRSVTKESEFCPKCGTRMDAAHMPLEPEADVSPVPKRETPVPPDPKESIPPIPAITDAIPPVPEVPPLAEPNTADCSVAGRKCPSCGAENGIDTKFCLSCGRIIL